MASLNEIRIIGNLGGDPEMRFTPGGKPVTNFNVATNRTYRSKDGEQAKETEWFTVVAWDRQAESCNQFLKKGSPFMSRAVSSCGHGMVMTAKNVTEMRFTQTA